MSLFITILSTVEMRLGEEAGETRDERERAGPGIIERM
jgi:hypothetical protein